VDRRKSGRLLSDFIDAGKRPRNQIATLSGLTNTYIRNLENGQIENVPRYRLIALGVALNLDLSELEQLLEAFDRAKLNSSDVPTFLDVSKNISFSEADLSVRDMFAYELALLSLERAPGSQVIVNDRPTISFLPRGHRTHIYRGVLSRHRMYSKLIEAVGRARRDNFFQLVSGHRIDHYICRRCLEDYLGAEVDEAEKLWRTRHVAQLLDVVRKEKKFHLFLTDACVNFNFTMKMGSEQGAPDKLSYSARAPHEVNRSRRGRLIGFITESPNLCQCFKDELSRVGDSVIEELKDRKRQEEYLEAMLESVSDILGVEDGQRQH
jgi:transcriptional regulator with XRE-family HTH domain